MTCRPPRLIVDFDEESSDFLPGDVGPLICSTCGFIANIDPDFHAERYAHLPTVRSETEVYTYHPPTGRFHRAPAEQKAN